MRLILQRVFVQLLNMGITGGYCITALLLLRLFFRKLPRKYFYALWLIAAFRLLCPVSISTQFSVFNLENFCESAPIPGTSRMVYIPKDMESSGDGKIHTGIRTEDALAEETLLAPSVFFQRFLYRYQHFRQAVQYLLFYGPYVWAAGVCLFLIYFAVGCRKLKLQVETSVCMEDNIYECDGLPSPFVMGIVKPKIYLPCGLNGKTRELILLHEQYHIRRKDSFTKMFAFFLLAVYWFHPLVWAAWFCMCQDMEQSCDEKVLEQIGEAQKKDYSLTLLALGAGHSVQGQIPPAFGENAVKSRIKHALRFQKPKVSAGILALLLAGAAVAALGTNAVQRKPEGKKAEEEQSVAELLYESRNPYVGDASADGRCLKTILESFPGSPLDHISGKMELQTSEEPYEFHFLLEEPLTSGDTRNMDQIAALMLALIGNLGEVHCPYVQAGTEEIPMTAVWSVQSVQEYYGIENIKDFASSAEKLQELLDILSSRSEEIRMKAIEINCKIFSPMIP